MNTENYFDRDLSWLSFNKRVLMEAENTSVPVFERIKFLAIYASNLDEFFEVRVALINRIAQINKEKINNKTELDSPKKLLKKIYKEVNAQQEKFGSILRGSILPLLKKEKIHLHYNTPYNKKHFEEINDIFYSKALSFIQPIIIRKGDKKTAFLNNAKLYLVCELEKDNVEYIGLVNIPSDDLGRFFKLSSIDGEHQYTFLDDIIKEYSSNIFSGFTIKTQGTIKLSRDAELFLEDDFTEDVAKKIIKNLKNREIGNPTRLLHDPIIGGEFLKDLIQILDINIDDCVSGGQYHNLSNLFSLPNPVGEKLENPANPGLTHSDLSGKASLFDAIAERDVLLSFPYQKYDYILRLFNEAAIDPEVVSIKATLYRVASDSHITNALISAARNGKKVEILVEAKARFDEENNLKWADKMKEAGVLIKFSSIALKVHSKVALISRKTKDGKLNNFAFLGTGNFNEKTAGIYTDYALLTSDPVLTKELEDTLNFIIHKEEKPKLKNLLVAQVNMPEKFTEFINKEIELADEGKEAKITLKLNNLQDKKMINLLYKAADAGVTVDLLIRGICCLVPRKNIQIIRLVDRYLEHARVYIFNNGGNEKILIGSADWMARNLYRRIEIVFPIKDEKIKEIIKLNINLQLTDTVKAVKINENLENIFMPKNSSEIRSQQAYYEFLKQESIQD